MKKYCVIARFDEETDKIFLKWKQKAHLMQENHYADKSWPPHMTLAAYENIDETILCNWVKEYVDKNVQMPIEFKSLGVYTHGKNLDTDVIFVNPCSSKSVVNFYYGFHEKLDKYCGSVGFDYSATCGQPVFHSTITICHKNEFNNILDYLRDDFVDIKGKIVALEVYEIPMKLLGRFDLSHK